MPNTCCTQGFKRRADGAGVVGAELGAANLQQPQRGRRLRFPFAGLGPQLGERRHQRGDGDAVRAIVANAASGLGSAGKTVVAPTLMAPSRPGQASGKLCAAGRATR